MVLIRLSRVSAIAAALVFSSATFSAPIDGNYVGNYSLNMNTHKEQGLMGMPWPEFALNGEHNGEKYKVLGNTEPDGVWRWDFDNEVVTIRGSMLQAFVMMVPFQAFNQNEIENVRSDEDITITSMDQLAIPLSYDEASGLYHLTYAHKKYFDPSVMVPMATPFPVAITTTHFHVEKNEDGTLSITTADVESGIESDNVPGTRIENVFPAVVQTEYRSSNMVLDTLVDTNQNGITDAMSALLYLDPMVADTDGDNIDDIIETTVYLRGLDSDQDGLSDAHEAGELANNAAIVSGVSLQGMAKFTLSTADGETFQHTRSYPLDVSIALDHTLASLLPPEFNEDQKVLDYGYGNVAFAIDNPELKNSVNLSLAFDAIPEGLEIYHVAKELDMELGKFVQKFNKLEWTATGDTNVALQLSNPDNAQTILAELLFAAPEKKTTVTDSAEETGSSSGGSMSWLSFVLMAAFSLFRRREKR